MNRYFKAPSATLNAIRLAVMAADPAQPNSRADEPWPIDGTFNDGTYGYISLGPHHYEGEYAAMVAQFLALPGVEEITQTEYRAAMPEPSFPYEPLP